MEEFAKNFTIRELPSQFLKEANYSFKSVSRLYKMNHANVRSFFKAGLAGSVLSTCSLNSYVNLKEANYITYKAFCDQILYWLCLTCFLIDLICVRALLCCELKSFALSLSGVISRPEGCVESVLNPVSDSNHLVFWVLDIFICRVMNKVASIVHFKQSQLETPHASVLAMMSIRDEDYCPAVPTALSQYKSWGYAAYARIQLA